MGTRLKLKEVKNFISNIKNDTNSIDKKEKLKCWRRIILNLFKIIWNATSSLFIYPIWYFFRIQITKIAYKGTSWQEIQNLMNDNQTDEVKKK